MKLSLFLILTGMVTILFAGVTLKNKTVEENPYKCALGLEDHKPFLYDTVPFKIENMTIDRSEFNVQSKSDGRIVAYETNDERVINIIDSADNVVAFWKDGKWDIKNCERSIEVSLHCLRNLSDLLNKRRVEEINNDPIKPISFTKSIEYDHDYFLPTDSAAIRKYKYSYFVGEPIDTLPKQSYIMFQETGTSIYHNGVEVALRRKNGTWKVIDSRKALEVMYDNIYKREAVRKK